MVAIATCVAAATDASAQTGSLVLNNQLQLGDVISGQTLNVENAAEQVTVSNTATGNSVNGAVQTGSYTFRNVQQMSGDVRATTTPSSGGGEVGVVNGSTVATGNYTAAGAYDADLDIDSDQQLGPHEIEASTSITGGTARLVGGAYVSAAATGNIMALGGQNTVISGAVHQASDASVRASNLAEVRYVPAEAIFSSQAIGNATSSSTSGSSGHNLYVGQRSTGDIVVADTSANAGNAWDIGGTSAATANQAVLHNVGGSVVARTQQENFSQVQSTALVTSYDFGAARAHAQAAGNAVSVGNEDLYLELDNDQINSGGVGAQASFAGTNGYDVYVSSEAVGNTVTGYACAECGGSMQVTNSQVNDGAVTSASATTVVNQGRAVITSSNAVGNAATFYVSRPGN